METYTDFGVSYLIQSFVNKINTKSPSPPNFFQKEHFTFYKTSKDVLFE